VRAALSFLTAYPGARVPTARSLPWFPVVGAVLGLALGGLWWATAKVWPWSIAAVIVVVADLALTGMLHFDGLADSADGLLPHLTLERRLEVMREPTVGAFGVVAVAIVLIGRWAVLAVVRPAPLLLAALWCVSRSGMAATVDRVRYARIDGGLASAFQGARLPAPIVLAAVGASAAVAAVWSVPAGPAAVGACVVGFIAVLALAERRIGGYTGDVLGAAGVVGETVGLLVAAARW
jgi:adenosylcobinamide-GDP ribazoletransferase